LISLSKAVRIAPSSSAAHAGLGAVLAESNDLSGAEREMRLALKAGGSDKQVLPSLFQIMLARKEFDDLLKQFPDPSPDSALAPDVLKARAFALQRLGRGTEALDAVDRALKIRRDGAGLLARANISLQQGDAGSANRYADEAIKMSPGNLEIAVFKLAVMRYLGDSGAMAFCEQLLKKFPGDLRLQFMHVDLLLDQKQDAKAKSEIDAIVATRPGLPMGVYYQAMLRSRAGDAKGAWDLALGLPKESLERAPAIALSVAQMAENAGHREAAANLLGKMVGADPGNRTARLRLATIYLDQDNANSALNVLNPIKDTADPQLIALLARIYTRLGRNEEAAKTLKRLAGASGGTAQEIVRNALANIQAGHLDQAIKDLSQARAKDPLNPVLAEPLINALLRAQKFADALAVADKFAADPKLRPIGMEYRGDILAQKRDLTGAAAAFSEVIKLAPDNKRARYARAGVYVLAQKYADADRDLRAILTQYPKDSGALLALADIAARQGRDSDVRSDLAKAIAGAPQEMLPRLTLARYLARRCDVKGALSQVSEMVRSQPSNAVAVELQAELQLQNGLKKDALASYRRLVTLAPQAPGAQAALGDVLYMTGDRSGAAKALDMAVTLAPKSPAIRAAQINLRFMLGQADQAVSSAQAFHNANPGPDGDILLADAWARTNHVDKAMELLANSFASNPTRGVLSRYGRLAIAQNQSKRAEEALASWLQKNPTDDGARIEFANYYLERNDNEHAIPLYDAVLKREPNNALALNNLGGLLQVSNPGRALTLLTKAEKLAPNSPDVNDSLGWLKVLQKDAAGGLVYLRRAHSLRPQDPRITYHLIVALDADNKRAEARPLLKALLSGATAFPDKEAALKLSAQWH